MGIFFRLIPILCSLIFSYSSFAADKQYQVYYIDELKTRAKTLELSQHAMWLKLGHYKKSFFGGYKSEAAASSPFFISSDGYKDPDAELMTTLERFLSPEDRIYESVYIPGKKDQQHPICQFPARFAWLNQKLGFDSSRLPKVDCVEFHKFQNRIGAKSVSLVFSSYYLNNPSSAFGHTLIRVNKTQHGSSNRDRHELLDFGINFSAEVTTSNSLLYALNGMLGLFRGIFSNIPYYYKVREYNDYEARDLWSYDLNLTNAELEMLVAHLWEMGSSWFPYYFFKQNCSYQILAALEVAVPAARLSEVFTVYAIPGDTLRQVMNNNGLAAGFSYRPSARSKFFSRFKNLRPEEKISFKTLTSSNDLGAIALLSNESQARVLDTAMDYSDFKNPEDLVKRETHSAKWKQELLIKRAQIPIITATLDATPPLSAAPHLGHGSARAGFDVGFEGGAGAFADVKMRFALHDLLDPRVGFPKNSQVEFMNLRGRFFFEKREAAAHKAEIEEIAIIRITSFSPIKFYDKQKSWKVEFGARRVRDGNCDRCLASNFKLGVGAVLGLTGSETANDWLELFAFGETEAMYSPYFYRAKINPSVGPNLGLLVDFDGFPLKGLFQTSYRYIPFAEIKTNLEFKSEVRWSLNDVWALNLTHNWFDRGWEVASGFYHYF